MNVKVASHGMDNALPPIPAIVDVDYCSDQFVVNVHHLAVFLSHGLPPFLLPFARQARRCFHVWGKLQKQGCRKFCS
ncbi:hypothetical protein Xekj_03274 [Xenorhabdus sp. KJ12.1]|nr:hypothetical protein Xekj_03274 [Xenorhabdus sp. KJ12.1]